MFFASLATGVMLNVCFYFLFLSLLDELSSTIFIFQKEEEKKTEFFLT